MKILAVEDDPIARAVLQASLLTLGHEVFLAEDGEEAWKVVERESIRVIVSDWDMPKIDGLDLCRQVRREAKEYVYFILLTNLSGSQTNEDIAVEAGVDDFLRKPANTREIKSRLHVAERILHYTSQIRELESFIPICCYCKNVRDDHNYWTKIETYINDRTGSEFSHGICPECYSKEIIPQLKAQGVRVRPTTTSVKPANTKS